VKSVSCNLCGSSDYRVLFKRRDLSLGLGEMFTIVQCQRCSLVYQNPRPSLEELFSEYYPPEKYDQYTPLVRGDRFAIRRYIRTYGLRKRYRAVIEHHPEAGRVLDIGCSTGNFLDMMREHGWNVQGVEPGFAAAAYANDQVGISVFNGTLEEAHFDPGTFDVITMWDVIEHLPDPAGSLQEVFRILKDDGLLVVATPQLDSIDAKLFGRFWIGYELPRHLTVFSRRTLSQMAEQAGFALVDRQCFFGSFFAFYSSVRFWLRAHMAPGLPRATIEKLLFSPLLQALQWPYFAIADRLGQSSTITYFYHKQK
jgi:2-polyprenyl-3-methyl-5-hydroxy-6-metoxy-1,4-benzoquinol methylase